MIANHQFTIQEIEDADILKEQVPERWLGFALAVASVWILSSANISTQWVGLVV